MKRYTRVRFAEENEITKYLACVLRNPRAYGIDRCLLCGGKPAMIGTYFPDRKHRSDLGIPAENKGMAIYAACQECFDQPDSLLRFESQIKADLAAGTMGLDNFGNLRA